MDLKKWFENKKKLEIIPDEIVNVKEFYYFDKNDNMIFTDKFKKWCKE